jgi:hypothetical protein
MELWALFLLGQFRLSPVDLVSPEGAGLEGR